MAYRDLNAWQVVMLEKLVLEELTRNPGARLADLLKALKSSYKVRSSSQRQ